VGGDGVWGLSGWRVMFLVEGIPAILLAAVTFWYLADRPADARWLPDDERACWSRGWRRRRPGPGRPVTGRCAAP
jgi:MFS family permease